jgi:hypothetical protein
MGRGHRGRGAGRRAGGCARLLPPDRGPGREAGPARGQSRHHPRRGGHGAPAPPDPGGPGARHDRGRQARLGCDGPRIRPGRPRRRGPSKTPPAPLRWRPRRPVYRRPSRHATRSRPADPAAFETAEGAHSHKGPRTAFPLAAIEAVERSLTVSSDDAFDGRAGGLHRARDSEQSAALRHIFFAERAVSRIPEAKGAAPRPLGQVGVLGGGTMGAGIAAACLLARPPRHHGRTRRAARRDRPGPRPRPSSTTASSAGFSTPRRGRMPKAR